MPDPDLPTDLERYDFSYRGATVSVEEQGGVRSRENWDAELTDLLALVKHVAANPQHLNLLQLNQVAARAQAKSLKGAMNIPGLKAFDKGTVSVR